MEAVEYSVDGSIATITLDRPESMNAMNVQLREDLDEAIERVAVDDDVRAVMINGSGRAFSSGADHDLLREMGEHTSERFRWEYRRLHRIFDNITHLEKPVVAAIDGVCVGGGLELALYCDFMVASEGSLFGFPEDNIGLIPASGACTKLAKEVGTFQAKELILTTSDKESMIDAREAHERFGFVCEVYDPENFDEKAEEFTRELAESAPLAVAMAKKIINHGAEMDVVSGREFERTGQSQLMETEDYEEGMQAFQEKRSPEFQGK